MPKHPAAAVMLHESTDGFLEKPGPRPHTKIHEAMNLSSL